ncbi:hypothetical protein PFICI_11889 [Pestalotiopsis fici W106-1]|uniref:NB-ARC domain-containing protein n=1 Tax=Pestalotiopsis fici (strain W106-1 / CGMCC3.15140) TaxID=1229662 RepID=W3WTK7_PESFW|nr:uncharacterized protein PFICI_11889 [Pestalotiopsis fici W106-1]ETS76502.1 hypothetical protein PFICI_11889 [Pestalotiopsis fici W106-1]
MSSAEFDRLTLAEDSTDSNRVTPLSILDDDESHQIICEEWWEEALRCCKDMLNDEDYKTLEEFGSEEKFVEALLGLREDFGTTIPQGISRLLGETEFFRQQFRDILANFMFIMLPRSVTTGMAWGLTYLVVQVMAKYVKRDDDTASKYAKMILDIRRQLALVKRGTPRDKDMDPAEKQELRHVYITILQALIQFWRDSIKYLRGIPKTSDVQLEQEWKDIEKSFAKAFAAIGETEKFLERYYKQTNFRQQPKQPDGVKLKIFPVHTIPPPMTSLFVGREDILTIMGQWLQSDRHDRNGLAIYTLCGIGGVGKTELAQEYANSAKTKLDAVFWVMSEKKDLLAAEFSNIAVQLHLEGAKFDGDAANNRRLVQDWFRTADESWLLILDNVEDFDHIKDYLPPPESKGSVIVTTRYPGLARRLSLHGGRSSTVEKLGKDQARNLFLELLFREEENSTTAKETQFQAPELPPQEVKALDFLLKELDGLALGIQQMVASIKHGLPSCTHNLAKFVKRYQKHLPHLLEKDPAMRPHRLNTLWAMTFDNMRTHSSNPYAWNILGTLCCFQPDEIPMKVFLDLNPSLAAGNLEFCSDEFYVVDGISFLRNLGLVDVQGESDDRISLHRLTQVAFILQKDLEGSERQTIFESASVLINDAFPKQIEGRMMYGDWEKCREYIKHAMSLYDLYGRLKGASLPLSCTQAFAELMTNCAWYVSDLGDWDDTLQLTHGAAEACKEVDEGGLTRAHLLNTESQIHFSMNKLDKCREALEESQRIREKRLGLVHEELANTYMNLGNLEAAEGNYDKSLDFYERSIHIREQIPNPGAQLMVGLCHLNLARALLWKGDFESSGAELDKSQSIMEEHGGENYHDIVFVHFMRGNLYFEQGDLEKARELYQASLDMLVAQMSTHPKVAAIHFKIGTTHYRLGRWQEAMVALSKALHVARNREENTLGEQARIIRRQAQVLESIPSPGPSVELLRLVNGDSRDSETLRAIAERLRFRVTGIDSFQARYTDDEEEIAFNMLVGFFDR